MCSECEEEFVIERHIDIRKGDWVKYTGTKFGLNLVFQGEGLFLGTRKVHGFEHLAYLGEDNKETVLFESWNSHGRLYREVKE